MSGHIAPGDAILAILAVAVLVVLAVAGSDLRRARRGRIHAMRRSAARLRCPGLPVDGDPLTHDEFADAAELEIALIAQFGGAWIRQWNQQTSLMALMDAGRQP